MAVRAQDRHRTCMPSIGHATLYEYKTLLMFLLRTSWMHTGNEGRKDEISGQKEDFRHRGR